MSITFFAQFYHFAIHIALVVIRENNIDTLNGGDFVGFELCIAPCYGNYCLGIEFVDTAYYVATFFVGVFGYGATVDDANIGLLEILCALPSTGNELAGEGGGLREVELTSQCVETNFHFSLLWRLFWCESMNFFATFE